MNDYLVKGITRNNKLNIKILSVLQTVCMPLFLLFSFHDSALSDAVIDGICTLLTQNTTLEVLQ